MREIEQYQRKITEQYWSCGAASCATKHGSSVAAARCPARLQQLRRERLEAGHSEEELTDRLLEAMVAGCECQTKTPEPRYHNATCKYRLLYEAHQHILQLRQELREADEDRYDAYMDTFFEGYNEQ